MDAKDRRQLVPLIRHVLQQAGSGTGPNPHYVSSYQILERLEEPARSDLLKKYGPGGKGAGRAETGPRVIADVLKRPSSRN
jgi:hypothetical protein